ncbi:MAG: helix-turn-helix domain-containing protein [Lachnospiraceae bacterium]|nr:helix-turn-helix domain-containing protein [Lachnospiraceae bacterium]
MISNQTIKTSIDKLKAITKIDFSVRSMDGYVVASTDKMDEVSVAAAQQFAASPADSQELQGFSFFKVPGEDVPEFILIAKGSGEDVHMVGRIAVSQLQDLIIAYKERFDKNNFVQNLLLDNLLLVDIYNRAKKLRIEPQARRAVYIIETKNERDNSAMEVIRNLYGDDDGNLITEVDEKSIILIRALEEEETYDDLEKTAAGIRDTLNTEAMIDVRVSCGTIVNEIAQVSRSFKEARMALNVGKIFYSEQRIHMYRKLGIGRLIYQLPENLCRLFLKEVFTKQQPETFDEETITTINMFFGNSLNVSETARQLFVHRNTLVYRLEKLSRSTGLDIRSFDDAVTFKIALMVENYLKYIETHNS